MAPLRLAIISVADQRGAPELAARLVQAGYTIVAGGSTAQFLASVGVPLLAADQLTGVPEILDGRVQTLHPAVHGGIVARRDRPEHLQTLNSYNVTPIDIVVVNLQPLAVVIADRAAAGWPEDAALDGIDIAGAALVRSAAGNFNDVLTLVDPADYDQVLDDLSTGMLGLDHRKALAAKAFAHLASLDREVSAWLGGLPTTAGSAAPIDGGLRIDLGVPELLPDSENPQQSTWHHADATGLLTASPPELQEHAKTLTAALQRDGDLAWRAACDLPPGLAGAVVAKHGNPVGAASLTTSIAGALLRATDCDPAAIAGAVLAVNRPFDLAAARALGDKPIALVLAPRFDEEAVELLASKTHLQLLALGDLGISGVRHMVQVTQFGVMMRTVDSVPLDLDAAVVVTKASPTVSERRALDLAWRVAKHVRSNAVVIADENGTVGIGAGQVSRLDAGVIAVGKCRKGYRPLAAAADGPFLGPEALEPLFRCGLRAIVQPGGTLRDAEIAAAADALGISLLLTGVSHFRY